MEIFKTLFNTDSLKQSRLPWIDFTKGVAIIFVVYRHILVGLNRTGIYFDPIYSIIAEVGLTFRMHLFFIVAGIFLRKSLLKRTNKKFITDKLKSLIYPYLIWTVIQVTLQIAMGQYTNAQRSPMDYLYILTNPRAIDQFWFIYALFNVTILYLLVFRVTSGNKWLITLIASSMYVAAPLVKVSVLDDIFNYFPFLVIGDLVASFLLDVQYKKYINLKGLIILALLFSMAIWIHFTYTLNYFQLTIIALLGSALTINLAFLVSKTLVGNVFRIFGVHSLYLFLMHSMMAAMIRIFLIKVLKITQPEVLLFICAFGGCVLPIIAYNIMKKANLWFFFTPDNPNKKGYIAAI